MGLLDRHYLRDAPRWHMGEGLAAGGGPAVQEQAARVVQRRGRRGHVQRRLLAALLTTALCALLAPSGARLVSALLGPSSGAQAGVHVCALAHYDAGAIQCTREDRTIVLAQLAAAQLCVSGGGGSFQAAGLRILIALVGPGGGLALQGQPVETTSAPLLVTGECVTLGAVFARAGVVPRPGVQYRIAIDGAGVLGATVLMVAQR